MHSVHPVVSQEAMNLTLYGIPTCGTVKKALGYLTSQNHPHTFIDYRKNPPSREDITSWVTQLGNKALRNTSGGSYRALGDEKDNWGDDRWIDAFVADPMLIKRPVVVLDGKLLQVGWASPDAVEAALKR